MVHFYIYTLLIQGSKHTQVKEKLLKFISDAEGNDGSLDHGTTQPEDINQQEHN